MALKDFLFYEEPGITLYCGDCREVLPLLPYLIGACVTDPPYGINYHSHNNSSRGRSGEWKKWIRDENFKPIKGDDKPIDPALLLLYGRVVIFGGNFLAHLLPPSKCWLVWDKRDGVGSNNQADCEFIWTNLKKPSRLYRHLWSGLLRAGEENVAVSEKLHPNQKPVALVQWVIEYAECPSDLPIVDPYAGSGTTLLASKRLGYEAIGIEIEPKYCEIAVKRLRQSVLALS